MQKKSRQILIIVAVVGFLIGIILGRSGLGLSPALIVGTVTVAAIGRKSRLGLVLFALAGLGLGIWRGQASLSTNDALTSRIGQTVVAEGRVADDPVISDKGQLSFTLGGVRLNGQPVNGQISVYSYRVAVLRGYRVRIEGKLKDGFGNKPASMSYGQLTITNSHLSGLDLWRQQFVTGLRNALPEPLAGFALGLLIGARALIPKALQDQLNTVGLSHLIAVSGYNLTIITNAVARLFGKRHKFLRLASVLWLIAGFIAVSGASASIVRAAVVATLVLLARYDGFELPPLVIIAVAAGLTAAWRPEYVTSDLGWQLSFAAFVGIMVLAPLIEGRLPRPPKALGQIVIESLSAQILATPLILAAFGTISIVAPISNAIILPIVPLAMAASFLAGLAGTLVPVWCGWLAWPAALLLRAMLWVINHLASLSWASMTTAKNAGLALGMYAAILLGMIFLSRMPGRDPLASESRSK